MKALGSRRAWRSFEAAVFIFSFRASNYSLFYTESLLKNLLQVLSAAGYCLEAPLYRCGLCTEKRPRATSDAE